MKEQQLHISLTNAQHLSEDEIHHILGVPAAAPPQQVGPLTVLMGPASTASPDLQAAQQAFNQGKINGYGTVTQ